jgi:hypothetical protein
MIGTWELGREMGSCCGAGADANARGLFAPLSAACVWWVLILQVRVRVRVRVRVGPGRYQC